MRIQTPSGVWYEEEDLELLREMAKVGFVRYSAIPFELRSRIMSNVYVFGREDLTDNPQLEFKVGAKIARVVYDNSFDECQPCLIGLPRPEPRFPSRRQ